jgi:hypothetical protein
MGILIVLVRGFFDVCEVRLVAHGFASWMNVGHADCKRVLGFV